MARDDPEAWWERTWEARERALDAVLGKLDPPGTVVSVPAMAVLAYPGFCIRRYRAPGAGDKSRTFCTLGASQPAKRGERGRNFELTIDAQDARDNWPVGVLISLEQMLLKGFQPGAFNFCHAYRKADGSTVLGSQFSAAHRAAGDKRIGKVGGILFAPRRNGEVQVPGRGTFELFAITLLTGEDTELLEGPGASPAAMLLWMERLGLGRSSALDRPPLMAHRGAAAIWNTCKRMAHPAVMAKLGIH